MRVWVASQVRTKVDSERVGVLLWLRVMIYGELWALTGRLQYFLRHLSMIPI